MQLRRMHGSLLLFFVVLSIVCNITSLVLVMYFGRHLIGGSLVCTPPEDYVEDYYRQRVYKSNKGLMQGL